MAALRSLLRAHALDARRDGLLAPALLLLAAAPSAADARVLESGCAAILTALRKWARRAARAATLCATGCSRTLPGCIPTHPGCNRTYPRCAALLAAHESAPLAQHTASASQAAGRGEAKEALRHLDLALEIDAEHADTWARRARLHAQEGQHAPALEAAQRALNRPRHNLNPPTTPTPNPNPTPKLTPASTPTAAPPSNPTSTPTRRRSARWHSSRATSVRARSAARRCAGCDASGRR